MIEFLHRSTAATQFFHAALNKINDETDDAANDDQPHQSIKQTNSDNTAGCRVIL